MLTAEVVEEWLGIISLEGVPLSAPPDWLRLVRLLAIQEVTPRGAHDEERTIAQFLQRICGELTAAKDAFINLTDSQYQSPWGRFRIRAYRMPGFGGNGADNVGVLIGRSEPRALALVRATGASGLSPQQREVALLLADGKSNQEIARSLSLKLNTASYHVKQVFTRLKVHKRKEVERELLKLAHDATLHRAHDVASWQPRA
jgi:DNA-binding CsgD family transcriptional regulator